MGDNGQFASFALAAILLHTLPYPLAGPVYLAIALFAIFLHRSPM